MLNTAISDPYELARKVIKPGFPKLQFRVLVLGPALKPTEVVAKPLVKPRDHETVLMHGRYLRYATKGALEKEGFSVDFGETRQMLEFWQEQFGARDPGSAEVLQAERMTGAVVVFPSSASSLCELGMFSTQKRISEKTLAIVHRAYQNDKSFFRRALLEFLDQDNGKFQFKDYANHEVCVAEAVRFVTGKYQSLLRGFGLIEQAERLKRDLHGTAFDKKKQRRQI
jgi:hypothetical protein